MAIFLYKTSLTHRGPMGFPWFSYGFSTPKPRLGDLGAQAPAAPLDLWPSLDAAGGVDQSGGGSAARGMQGTERGTDQHFLVGGLELFFIYWE